MQIFLRIACCRQHSRLRTSSCCPVPPEVKLCWAAPSQMTSMAGVLDPGHFYLMGLLHQTTFVWVSLAETLRAVLQSDFLLDPSLLSFHRF